MSLPTKKQQSISGDRIDELLSDSTVGRVLKRTEDGQSVVLKEFSFAKAPYWKSPDL